MAHMDDVKAAEVADKIETVKRDLANFVQALSTDNEVAQRELLAMELRRLTGCKTCRALLQTLYDLKALRWLQHETPDCDPPTGNCSAPESQK